MNVATPAQPHTGTVRRRMRGQKMEFFFSPDNDWLVIIRNEQPYNAKFKAPSPITM